jgi:hypothetical protein
LALEEIGLRLAVGHAMGMAPELAGLEPDDWPVETYLSTLSRIVPGYPSAEELLRLAEPARPDPKAGCWEPFLDPTLMLCAKNDGWAPCQHCERGLCAE